MAFSLNIRLTGPAPRLVAALEKRIGSDEVTATTEIAAETAWKEHMATHYIGRVNRLGGQSTGYYRGAYESIDSTRQGRVVRLSMRQVGLRLHYQGGTVRPSGRISSITGKPIRFLTIPAAPEAHGRTASQFPNLRYGRAQGPGLYDPQTGKLLFRLARKATIRPDPNLIPPGQFFANRIATALQALIDAT